MSIHLRKGGGILLFFLLWLSVVSAATNYSGCFKDVVACAKNSSGCTSEISNPLALSVLRTSQGQYVTSPDKATALSLMGCNAYCGTGQESSERGFFSHEYAVSLLPYLTLVSQLPFGAHSTVDNLMSALLTLGSPTLAGYSLFMTLLNPQFINSQLFSKFSDCPSAALRQSVVRALSGLQQFHFHIHPRKYAQSGSLVVYSHHEAWWKTFANELNCSHGWPVASVMSIAWVVIVYVITASTSILSVPANKDSNGLGIGSALLWLLPIVMGWLILSPRCDHKRVQAAYQKANKRIYVANLDSAVTVPAPVTEPIFGLSIPSCEERSQADQIISPDDLRTPPVFNYAKVFSWYRNVYLMSLLYLATPDRMGTDDKLVLRNGQDDVPQNHLGACHQITPYYRPYDRVPVPYVLWHRDLIFNMAVASLMSLQLQWGTIGASFLIAWFTPTTGLGCRSLVYLVYGTISTAVWGLLVASSAIGYYAHHLMDGEPATYMQTVARRDPPCILSNPDKYAPTINLTSYDLMVQMAQVEEDKDNASLDTCVEYIRDRTIRDRTYGRVLSRIADRLRWIGKGLAVINAIGIIANTVLQYTGAYASCFCNSNVWTWGTLAFNVINPNASDVELTRKAWMGAVVLALSCCSFFVGSICLVQSRLHSELRGYSTHDDAYHN